MVGPDLKYIWLYKNDTTQQPFVYDQNRGSTYVQSSKLNMFFYISIPYY